MEVPKLLLKTTQDWRIVEHMEGDAGKGMSGCLGPGNDERFDFMLQAADRLLGVRKLVGMVDLVANCRVGFEFMGRLGIRGDALGQGFAALEGRTRSAKER